MYIVIDASFVQCFENFLKNIVQKIASLRIGKHRTEIASLRIGKNRIVKKETDIAHPQSRDSFWEPGLDFDICINLLHSIHQCVFLQPF